MIRLGVKRVGRLHSLGHKAMLLNTIGKKIGNVVMSGMNASKAHNTQHGVPENNMIYNQSNLSNDQYIPTGLGKKPSIKKSYLEKR